MIYVDSSVVLAELLDEDRRPSTTLWQVSPTSSRLAEYEVLTRLFRTGLTSSLGRKAHALLDRLTFIEMSSSVLERALEPFPRPLRTLDALHLATADFLQRSGNNVELASYDTRLIAAAKMMDIKIAEL